MRSNDDAKAIAAVPGPAYRIRTKRLLIRCWHPHDAPMLKEAIDANLDHLQPWMPWASKANVSLDERISWIRTCRADFDLDKDFVFGIFNPDETEVIGGAGLHTRQSPDSREIGCWIQRKYCGLGFGTEVAASLTKVAFLVDKVKRVEIRCAVENTNSAAIPKKLGFENEAILKKRVTRPDGSKSDSMVWSMFEDNFAGSIPYKAEIEAYDVIGRRQI